jgi:competence protein ComEC
MPPRSLDLTPARICLIFILVSCILAAGCTGFMDGGSGSSFRQGTTGDMRAYFLDVGQGDSSVILFRDKVILIDAGEVDEGDRVVSDLRKLGVTKIDLLVATHPHSDHIGGMQKVLAVFPVAKVLDSGMPSTSSLYERFLETVDEENIPYIVAEPGATIDIDPSLRILVLSPPEERIGDDLNTNSIVMRVSYGTVNILYAGDATTTAESAMLKTGYPLDAQVLKVGHHGSSGSGSPAFLSRVGPEVAVISLGEDNPYGHPHKEAMERLADAGAVVYRTDEDGTILVQSDGATYSIMTENGEGDIWQPQTSIPSPTGAVVRTTATGTAATMTIPVTLPPIPMNITVPAPPFTLPPVQVGNASGVSISAIQFDAPGDDRQNPNGEWVRLTNSGGEAVLLAGWTISDKDTRDLYTFPAFILMPDESVTLCVGSGKMNDTMLYMGMTEPVFANSGDEATLRDGSGNIIDQRPEG